MVIVVVIAVVVVVVVVAVAWIRSRNWGATVESDMAVRPIDVDARSGTTFLLCQLLCRGLRGAMLVRMMRIISPRQKRG